MRMFMPLPFLTSEKVGLKEPTKDQGQKLNR